MKIFPRGNLFGEYAVPPDKSITHMAIILGTIAKGKTTIINPLINQETLSILSCVKRMGAKVSVKKEYIEIKNPKKFVHTSKIDCGNSATAMRFVCGMAAGVGGSTVLTGSKTLNQQPMREIKEPLEKMGATVALTNYFSAPILVESNGVRAIDYMIGDGNSQVKSSILFCALTGGVRAVIHEQSPSRNHTEILLKEMGADISVKDDGKTVDLGVGEIKGGKISVSRDFTLAAHYLALGILLGKVVCHNVNINPTRTAFIDVLRRMGADIRIDEKGLLSGERIADIITYKSKLKSTHILKEETERMIDELPLIAFLMGLAEGESVIYVGKTAGIRDTGYRNGVILNDYLDSIANAVKSVGGKCRRFDGGLVINGIPEYIGGTVKSDGFSFISAAGAIALTASVNGGDIDEDYQESDANKAFFDELLKNSFAVVRRRTESFGIETLYADAINMTGSFTTSVTAVFPTEDNFRKLMSELKNYSGYSVFPPYIGETSRRLYTLRGLAKLARSANVVSDGSGYFTDGDAFVAAMDKLGEVISDKRVLVLGCGGLGRGVICSLIAKGARVDVYDVAQKQAGEYVKRTKLNVFALDRLSGNARYDYVINTVYRADKVRDDSEDLTPLKNSDAVVDLTSFGSSPFKIAAADAGVRVIEGKEFAFMQAYYAACAFAGKERHEQKAFSMFDIYYAEK